jgi:hypothetical protein
MLIAALITIIAPSLQIVFAHYHSRGLLRKAKSLLGTNGIDNAVNKKFVNLNVDCG